MKKLVILAMALVPLTVSSSVFAQSLIEVKGKVLVNRGSGFVPVRAGSPIALGDRIMVRPGSRAVLQYGPNCRVNVVPGEVVTITETPVCAASDGTNPRTQVSDGGGAVKKLDSDQFEFGFGGFNPGYVIIGGALIAGGLLITLNTPSDNPTSP